MQIVIIIFTISVFVSSLYWLVLFVTLTYHKSPQSYTKNTKTSILVAAKNEAKNLQVLLPKLKNQEMDFKEIIIIDDFSTDQTKRVIQRFSPSIKYYNVKNNLPGKKQALTEGIEQSTYNHLLLTDADCVPSSEHWASIMTSPLIEKVEVVLGFGGYQKTRGWLNRFVRYESVLTALQYFAYAILGAPYMAVGRNLAFKKPAFDQIGGYKNHKSIISGDDDLLIRDIANASNTAISLDPKSFTFSIAPKSFNDYVRQKMRHVSTAIHYKLNIKLALSIHPFFYLVSIFCALFLLFSGNWIIVISLFSLRWILLMLFGFSVFSKLQAKDLILFIPLLDLCWTPYYLFFSIPSFSGKSKHW